MLGYAMALVRNLSVSICLALEPSIGDAEQSNDIFFDLWAPHLPATESPCADFKQRVSDYLFQRLEDSSLTPEHVLGQAKRLYDNYGNSPRFLPDSALAEWLDPVYLVDSVMAQGLWHLKAVSPMGKERYPIATFFEAIDGCEPIWIGPPERLSDQFIITTINGRFLCMGLPYTSTPEDELRLFNEEGRLPSIGDTVFVNSEVGENFSDTLFLGRFNHALSLTGSYGQDLSHERIIELFLRALLPYDIQFVIDDPEELDGLYRFISWPWKVDLRKTAGQDVWDSLTVAGLRNGRFLRSLPAYEGKLLHALPSTIVEGVDGDWFQQSHADDSIPSTVLKTVLLSRSAHLVQLRFTFDDRTGVLDRVDLIRIRDFGRHFFKLQ